MDLTERQLAILIALVNNYISTGEPVSSKIIEDMLDVKVSSATIRNELVNLSKKGYLSQPHTSAGRVPTNKGYRHYVDNIPFDKVISKEMQMDIDFGLEDISHTPEQLEYLACKLLTDITGYPSFLVTVVNDNEKVRRVKLIPMGKRTVLMVVFTTGGITKSRIVLNDSEVDENFLTIFSNVCKVLIVGHKLKDLNTAYLQTIAARIGGLGLGLMPVLYTLFDLISEICEHSFTFEGDSKVLSDFTSGERREEYLRLMNDKSNIIKLSLGLKEDVGVILKDDVEDIALVLAKYRNGDNDCGRIGIVGSSRMIYKQLLPVIDYFADRLSTHITSTYKDMEY